MEIAVMGAGAMGSLFGGLLAADGADVTLIDHGADHVAAVNDRGLVIVDETAGEQPPPERVVDVPATTHPADAGGVDLLLVFVKSHATAGAMADAAPLVGPETAVLTLQNGLGNAETIAEHVAPERVLAGTTTHGALRAAPGRVRHTGAGETALGPYVEGASEERARAVADRFAAAGIETRVATDVSRLLWEKVLVNVAINAPTALARVENGALARTDAGRRLVDRAVGEAERVARASGQDVRADAADYARSVAERTAANHSSMRRDVEAGRPTEVEALYGAVIERGAAAGVATPALRTLADLVRLAAEGV